MRRSAAALLLALATGLASRATAAEVSPQLAILSPLEFNLTGSGYVASLGNHFLTIPLYSVEAGMALYRAERFSIAGLVRFGFGQKRANVNLTGTDVSGARDGSVTWMPLLFGARTRLVLPSLPFFRPSLTVGFGGSWLRFEPDGASAVHEFVPLAFVTPAIHIFEPIEAMAGTVFQGFTFGLSYQRALFSVQRFQALAFEVSAQWAL